MERSKIYLDTEFTSLHRNASLISIGLVADDGRMFYAESTSFGAGQCSDWVKENILPNLILDDGVSVGREIIFGLNGVMFQIKSSIEQIAHALTAWLPVREQIEIWGDCLSYDWVLFCDLFGGAEGLPKNIYYIPFDIATFFKTKELDSDLDRETFVGINGATIISDKTIYSLKKHNALYDAFIIRRCYEKLLGV